ncbi:MAG: hypothetical protein JW720_12385, partial [Sedimentisphaerales bacterium]|nr:hypothetical protein [Sedimentisphaerales bacterium]
GSHNDKPGTRNHRSKRSRPDSQEIAIRNRQAALTQDDRMICRKSVLLVRTLIEIILETL